MTVEFLQPEEAAQVNAALLSSQEKFLVRVTIYGLRSLRQISEETGLKIEAITPDLVASWIQRDPSIHQQVEVDANFATFFSNLVVSSIQPLRQISEENNTAISELTVEQVIAWYERQAKRRVEQK